MPCTKVLSIRNSTFFEKGHLTLSQIVTFIYYWAYEMGSEKTLNREI
ncbi:hypothetical protein A3Q56_03282 [Intoshia linei]|uniref:Uncharacterized protein n=1 Tax=Intoshia linei TaxID=1819745 RepID=A0A177B5L4_9BILA|nr:hypothetical protein A3Q56_03282 [Intoshia linei]